MNMIQTLSMLSGETTVDKFLLLEDEELVEMIINKTDYTELLDYIEENY